MQSKQNKKYVENLGTLNPKAEKLNLDLMQTVSILYTTFDWGKFNLTQDFLSYQMLSLEKTKIWTLSAKFRVPSMFGLTSDDYVMQLEQTSHTLFNEHMLNIASGHYQPERPE